jgi:acyl-CoA oxidase
MTCVYTDFTSEVGMISNSQCRDSLGRLAAIYGLKSVLEFSAVLVEHGYVTPAHLTAAQDALETLYVAVRPDMLGLIEAFDWDDSTLNSALGRKDGDVYNTLMEWALLYPPNKEPVNQLVAKHILPQARL